MTISKIPQPEIRFLPGNRRKAELLKTYHIEAKHDGFEISITVPKGYVTDGASTPWFVWILGWTPFQGTTLPGAVIHDFLRGKMQVPWDVVDSLFHDVIREAGTGRIKGIIYYKGVRLNAWYHFLLNPQCRRVNNLI